MVISANNAVVPVPLRSYTTVAVGLFPHESTVSFFILKETILKLSISIIFPFFVSSATSGTVSLYQEILRGLRSFSSPPPIISYPSRIPFLFASRALFGSVAKEEGVLFVSEVLFEELQLPAPMVGGKMVFIQHSMAENHSPIGTQVGGQH